MGKFTVEVKKPSAWEFVTFGSGGLSLAVAAAEGGKVVLKSPSGAETNFYYGGVGAGLSAGLKLPKIGKVQVNTRKGPATGNLGPTAMPSTGKLYLTDSCEGAELSESDIQGLCLFTEVGGGLIVGASACAMYVGLNPLRLPLVTMLPGLGAQLLINSARGLLLMAGVNVGLQAQIGGAMYLGYLR